MFEKEAEEWTIDYICKDCSRYEKCKSKEHCTCKECSKDKWQNGAEFGYNKANEWHNLNENYKDLPNEGEWVEGGVTMKKINMTKEEFEKEAEGRARKLEESQTLGVYNSDEELAHDVGWNAGEVSGYEEGFKDGAEYVYNKCNVQLTKAKEIIKKLYSHVFQGMGFMEINDYNVQKAEAEQFLINLER